MSYRKLLYRRAAAPVVVAILLALAGCATEKAGSGGTPDAYIANAGDDDQITRCRGRIGAAAITESDSNAQALRSAGLPRSMAPLMRQLMMQARCFAVVERGAAFAALERRCGEYRPRPAVASRVTASSESASLSSKYVDPSSSMSTPRRVSNFTKRPMIFLQHRPQLFIGGRRRLDEDRFSLGAPLDAVEHQAVQGPDVLTNV